jgi:YHS domain-containing protein
MALFSSGARQFSRKYPECNNRRAGGVYFQAAKIVEESDMNALRIPVVLGILATLSACATLKTPTFADDMGAIRGYDPVAYHVSMMPVKGDPAYSYNYNNAVWFFSSEQNRKLFRDNPERYAPQYGGYCAYAMSKGLIVSTDPQAWKIEGDKLYLNYSLGVRDRWLKDVPGYVGKADANWQEKIAQQTFE